MGEGQIQAGGPVPDAVPVLTYATGLGEHEAAEWVELPDGLEFRVPPAPVGRQIVLQALALAVAIPLSFFAALGTFAAASPGGPGGSLGGTLLLGALTFVALRW